MAEYGINEATTLTLQWRASFNIETNRVHITIPVLIICNLAHDFTSRLRHSILAFTIQTLLAFLQIQSIGTNQPSPFQAHPVTTTASVVCVLAYYLSFGAKLWLPTYAAQLGFAMSFLGSFSVASLGSLLLPHSLWRFRYILFVAVMVAEWHPELTRMYNRFVWRLLYRPPRLRTAPPPLLPQTYMDLDHN